MQRTRPHIYGADPIILFSQPLHTRFIPVYTGLECINTYYKTIREWLIPVYTGQMPLICRSRTSRKVHPRAYGADTKFLKRIPVISKPFFLSWTSATEPVCIILAGHIFADNAFWSILARNDTYLGNCGVANSFPCIRGRSLIISPDVIKKWVHPRVYGADAISLSRMPLMLRFIPAYTGQIRPV